MVNTISNQRTTTYNDDMSRERRDGGVDGSGWRSWFGFGDKKEDDREYKYTRSYTGTVREPGYSTDYTPDYSYKYTDRSFPDTTMPTGKYTSRDMTTYDRPEPTEYYRGETYPMTNYPSTTYPSYRSYGNYTSGQQYPMRPWTTTPTTYGPEPHYTGHGYTSTTGTYGPEQPTRPSYYGQEWTAPRERPEYRMPPMMPYMNTCGGMKYEQGPSYTYNTPTGRGYYNESTMTRDNTTTTMPRPYGNSMMMPTTGEYTRPYGMESTYNMRPYGMESSYTRPYGMESNYTYGRGF